MDRHIGRTIVRNSAGDARVISSIFSGYHPQGLRESGVAGIIACVAGGSVVVEYRQLLRLQESLSETIFLHLPEM